MKNVSTVYYVFSVHQKGAMLYQNTLNHASTVAMLRDLGYSLGDGRGTYKGLSEESILIQGTNETESFIRKLCKQYKQECFLKIYYDNSVELVDPHGESVNVGKMVEIEKSSLLRSQDYNIFNDRTFVIQG